MIVPSRWQLYAWLMVGVLEVMVVWLSGGWRLSLAILLGWLGILVFSAWVAWREKLPFVVKREIGRVQQVGHLCKVRLSILHQAKRLLHCELIDHAPIEAIGEGKCWRRRLLVNQQWLIEDTLMFDRRGEFQFKGVQIRVLDCAFLWQREVWIALPDTVRVYPVFAFAHSHTWRLPMLAQVVSEQAALRLPQNSGDFLQFRQYVEGDSWARVDHRSSARAGRWLLREYEQAQEQSVFMMIDASRRLVGAYQGKALFDEVLAASAQLAQVVLAQGDAFGAQIFAEKIDAVLPSSSRKNQFNLLVEQFFNQQLSQYPPDFKLAMRHALSVQRQRSMMILVTVLEEGDKDELLPYLRLLAQKHEVIVLAVQPSYMYAYQEIVDEKQALEVAARDVYVEQSIALQEALAVGCQKVISTRADNISACLLKEYALWRAGK